MDITTVVELLRHHIPTAFSCFFFFSRRMRHTRFDCDWCSDVCSSDLWTPAPQAIARVDVVILGVEDVGGDEAELERLASICRLLVATEGALGARVYWNHDVRRLPSPPADPVDPTGAGDTFAAAFFVRYQQP